MIEIQTPITPPRRNIARPPGRRSTGPRGGISTTGLPADLPLSPAMPPSPQQIRSTAGQGSPTTCDSGWCPRGLTLEYPGPGLRVSAGLYQLIQRASPFLAAVLNEGYVLHIRPCPADRDGRRMACGRTICEGSATLNHRPATEIPHVLWVG
jgi:hypothetical protein